MSNMIEYNEPQNGYITIPAADFVAVIADYHRFTVTVKRPAADTIPDGAECWAHDVSCPTVVRFYRVRNGMLETYREAKSAWVKCRRQCTPSFVHEL